MKENRSLIILAILFTILFFVPFSNPKVSNAVNEAVLMLSEYAKEHVLLCLIPAFFIAGAITVFLNRQAVMKYLGPGAKKIVAYSVASVSGSILAVCSCTVLPLFKGIYRKGAGIGPAVSFLYSGPAINVLAIALTAKVLGLELGLARALGAIVFSFIIGLLMHLFYKKEDEQRLKDESLFQNFGGEEEKLLWQTVLTMASMIGILVFVNWAPSKGSMAAWDLIYRYRYIVTAGFALLLGYTLSRWFKKTELLEWVVATKDFALQVLPLLFIGVLFAGFILGRPDHPALINPGWIARLVGTNSIGSTTVAAASGAVMYFATLTEVPIMQGLLGAGMAKGPALALLLAGPSLSLPSMLVIGGELGLKKTAAYILLVITMSSLAGLLFGKLV